MDRQHSICDATCEKDWCNSSGINILSRCRSKEKNKSAPDKIRGRFPYLPILLLGQSPERDSRQVPSRMNPCLDCGERQPCSAKRLYVPERSFAEETTILPNKLSRTFITDIQRSRPYLVRLFKHQSTRFVQA